MTTVEIRQKKQELRQKNKLIRASMGAEERSCLDSKLAENILRSVSFKYADTLLLFYPKSDEIDLLSLFLEAKRLGKRVAFPKTYDGRVMKFYYVDELCQMKVGKYGIFEPAEDENLLFKSSTHPLVIVPCLACSKKGERLGYGGSYYDRFLKDFEGISACVCYEKLICDELPQEKRYDKKVDIIISESGVTVVGK